MSFLAEALARPLLAYPLEGPWAYKGFPKRVRLAGFPFTLARWKQKYPGVLAQYREDCVHRSMHAKVVRDVDGSLCWIIDHEDRYNPDRGRPIAHFFNDYEPGMIAQPAAMALAGLVLTKILVPLAPIGL